MSVYYKSSYVMMCDEVEKSLYSKDFMEPPTGNRRDRVGVKRRLHSSPPEKLTDSNFLDEWQSVRQRHRVTLFTLSRSMD